MMMTSQKTVLNSNITELQTQGATQFIQTRDESAFSPSHLTTVERVFSHGSIIIRPHRARMVIKRSLTSFS